MIKAQTPDFFAGARAARKELADVTPVTPPMRWQDTMQGLKSERSETTGK